MNAKKVLISLVWLGFAALNFVGFLEAGYSGLFEYLKQMNVYGWILFVDLLIALTMVLIWVWKDARAHGRNPWPYTLLTVALGSLGTMLYVLLSDDKSPEDPA